MSWDDAFGTGRLHPVEHYIVVFMQRDSQTVATLTQHTRRQSFCATLALIYALLPIAGRCDDQTIDQRASMSGFGSLGAVYGERGIEFQRDVSQPGTFNNRWSWKADSLLGVQADTSLTQTLHATLQLVLKERGDSAPDEVVEWAFLRYRPAQPWIFRAGRLGTDFYLLSEYRNVSFAYLWQRPVTEFYGMLVVPHFDGADATHLLPLDGGGSLRFKVFGGRANSTIALNDTDSAELELSPLWGGSIAFESERWRAQTSFARVTFSSDPAFVRPLLEGLTAAPAIVWPQSADLRDTLRMDGKAISFYSAGVAYSDDHWRVQSEIGRLDSNWASLRSVLSGYVSLGWHTGTVTPYIVAASARPVGNRTNVPAPMLGIDPDIDALYSAATQYANSIAFDQSTVSLGLRWDLRHNLALKLQWDHTRVFAGGSNLWFADSSTFANSNEARVDLLSATLNFVF